jgi:hypothetical protein
MNSIESTQRNREGYLARLFGRIAAAGWTKIEGAEELGTRETAEPVWNGGPLAPATYRRTRFEFRRDEDGALDVLVVEHRTQPVAAEIPRSSQFVQGAFWNSSMRFDYGEILGPALGV